MQNGDFVFNRELHLTAPIVAACHALVLQWAAIASVDSGVDIGRKDDNKQLPEVMANIEITCMTNGINVALTLLLFRVQFSFNLTQIFPLSASLWTLKQHNFNSVCVCITHTAGLTTKLA